MQSIKKALFFGVLVWLLPFIASMPFYSKNGQLSGDIFLLKTIMIIVGSLTGAVCLILYFKNVTEKHLNEGIVLGLLWLVINIAIDCIILIPMAKMDIITYFLQIGLRYLTIPITSITIGYLMSLKKNS